jgi:hypothetical protein
LREHGQFRSSDGKPIKCVSSCGFIPSCQA